MFALSPISAASVASTFTAPRDPMDLNVLYGAAAAWADSPIGS